MKKSFLLLAILSFTLLQVAKPQEGWFLSSPSLSPDSKNIAFVFEDDIWVVPSEGGIAMRITAMEGTESNPRFSPDNKWLAFNGSQDGNNNIYIVPTTGGPVKKITWHATSDVVDSWTWDSKQIIFTSGRYNSFSAYSVSIEGNTPVRLFGEHYWNNAHFVVQDKNSGNYYFAVSGESFRSSNRKRYKGDNNPDILAYNPKTDYYEMKTTWEGKDLWPTLDMNGNLFYASDEWNGEYNLYKSGPEGKQKLTSFTSSIGRPQVSADGKKVAFTLDYQIYVYDTGKGVASKVNIDVFSSDPLPNEKIFKTAGAITSFDISPDNKKIAFISRGELFVSDIKGKFIRQIETDPNERSLEVVWLNDNKTLLYTRTWQGWPNLFTITADGSAPPKQLTKDEKSARMLVYNEARTLLTYYEGTNELKLVNLATLEVKTLAKDEFWFRSTPASFSPDNNYIAYSAFRNFESDILICNIKTGEVTNLTSTYLSEGYQFWSPDGKYIYFTADRTKASYPRGGGNNLIYRIPLNRYPIPLRSDAYDAMFAKAPPVAKPEMKFDTKDLLFRWEKVGNISPSQGSPYVIMKDTLTTIIFTSSHLGGRKLYKMTTSPFDTEKIDEIKGVTGGSIVTAKKDYYILSGGDIYKMNLTANSTEKIDIALSFTRNLKSEFDQMFYEGWTILAENYYDINMHGTDWKAIKAKYEKFLPYMKSRNDLRLVMNDMLGELNSSHQGFSSRGVEETSSDNTVTVETGVMFSNSNPFTVDRILSKSPVDNYTTDIRKGDLLVSVNGVKINNDVSRDYYFTFATMPQELTLGFERASKPFEVRLRPIPSGAVNTLLYDEWMGNNQSYVDTKSDNSVAYVHVKSMGVSNLNDFLIEMTSEAVDRKALILDLRYNTGGNIHDDLINFLSQKPYLEWKFRDGMISPQPNFAPAGKPMVILVNEQSLSDAEMTTAGLKALKLGTIIGTETYRWIIFTSSKSLVDGSSCRLPAWGCYTLDGKDLEFEGIKPDIYINTDWHDKILNNDPQLDKALEVLLKEIGK